MPHIYGHSGIQWYYELEGEGEILLFLHGWGVDRRIWHQQTKFFSQYFKVLTIDLPGHGKSSFKKIPLEDMAKDLNTILEHLKVESFSMIGSSLGGLVGLKLYELNPKYFKKMTFVGSMPKFASSDDYPYGLDVAQMRKLSHQLNHSYPSIVNVFFRSLFTNEERQSRRFIWLQKFRQGAEDSTPVQQALLEYLDLLEHEDLRPVLKKVNIPVQFINGTGDQICTPKSVEYLKQMCPRAEFEDFENCGHFPFLSKPHQFNQILEEFLIKQ